jgi:hypothetical protein
MQTTGHRTCERPGCDRPHKAHGLCQQCYDAERGGARNGRPHRHRFVEQTAKNKATAILIRGHRDEYRALVRQIREDLFAAGVERERPCDPDAELDRTMLLAAICSSCAGNHLRGHRCPSCGADAS